MSFTDDFVYLIDLDFGLTILSLPKSHYKSYGSCFSVSAGQLHRKSHSYFVHFRINAFSANVQEMLLILLPLLNSSSIRNFLRPLSKDKSSSLEGDESACPICQASPTIPFLALPCEHRYISADLLIPCWLLLLASYLLKLKIR